MILQVEKQLKTGNLTGAQHDVLIKQLDQLYDLQRQKDAEKQDDSSKQQQQQQQQPDGPQTQTDSQNSSQSVFHSNPPSDFVHRDRPHSAFDITDRHDSPPPHARPVHVRYPRGGPRSRFRPLGPPLRGRGRGRSYGRPPRDWKPPPRDFGPERERRPPHWVPMETDIGTFHWLYVRGGTLLNALVFASQHTHTLCFCHVVKMSLHTHTHIYTHLALFPGYPQFLSSFFLPTGEIKTEGTRLLHAHSHTYSHSHTHACMHTYTCAHAHTHNHTHTGPSGPHPPHHLQLPPPTQQQQPHVAVNDLLSKLVQAGVIDDTDKQKPKQRHKEQAPPLDGPPEQPPLNIPNLSFTPATLKQ